MGARDERSNALQGLHARQARDQKPHEGQRAQELPDLRAGVLRGLAQSNPSSVSAECQLKLATVLRSTNALRFRCSRRPGTTSLVLRP